MVLEPREQGAEPQPQRRVVRSQPQTYEKLKPWSLPKLEPGSPASQPQTQGHQETDSTNGGRGRGLGRCHTKCLCILETLPEQVRVPH